MRGRILVQMGLLILEGVFIFIFAEMTNLAASIVMLTLFSICVQGAEGSTYGIVPYVNRVSPGAVAGIVGAGGPAGAVLFGLIFRQLPEDPELGFRIMAGIVVASGVICVLFNLKGHKGLIFGKESKLQPKLEIPPADEPADAEEDVQPEQAPPADDAANAEEDV